MPHFYVLPENISGNKFKITGEDVHYLADVRRYAVGDKLKLFDGKGRTLIGVIDSISKDEIAGTLTGSEKPEKDRPALHLFQAVPRGERFDWLVEKAAELGAAAVTPLITERSTLKEISEQKIERWRRLAKAACQQCGQADLMSIEKPLCFNDAIKITDASSNPAALNVIPWESENSKTLKEVFGNGKETKKVNIFIGPEGGFTAGEIKLAVGAGIVPVTLGRRILRSETAGLLSTVLVLQFLGEYEKKDPSK